MKYHLAKLTGFDVDACDKTTPEIMRIANQSIIDIANKRDAKEASRNKLTSTYTNTGTSASMAHNFSNPLSNVEKLPRKCLFT